MAFFLASAAVGDELERRSQRAEDEAGARPLSSSDRDAIGGSGARASASAGSLPGGGLERRSAPVAPRPKPARGPLAAAVGGAGPERTSSLPAEDVPPTTPVLGGGGGRRAAPGAEDPVAARGPRRVARHGRTPSEPPQGWAGVPDEDWSTRSEGSRGAAAGPRRHSISLTGRVPSSPSLHRTSTDASSSSRRRRVISPSTTLEAVQAELAPIALGLARHSHTLDASERGVLTHSMRTGLEQEPLHHDNFRRHRSAGNGDSEGSVTSQDGSAPSSPRRLVSDPHRTSPPGSPTGRGTIRLQHQDTALSRRGLNRSSFNTAQLISQFKQTVTGRVPVQSSVMITPNVVAVPTPATPHTPKLGWELKGRKGGARVGRAFGNFGIALVILVFWLCFGGMCMHFIEFDHEEQVIQKDLEQCNKRVPICQAIRDTLPQLVLEVSRDLTAKDGRLNGTLLDIREIEYSILAGCPFDENSTETQCNIGSYTAFNGANPWYFVSACYFCLITISTIGFGDIVPVTDFGKTFVVLYSIIGVPIMIYAVQALSTTYLTLEYATRTRRNKVAHRVESAVASLFGKRLKEPEKFDYGPRSIYVFVFGMATAFLAIAAFATYSYVTSRHEKLATEAFYLNPDQNAVYSFRDALYYSYIALATIGYGDYSPSLHTNFLERPDSPLMWLELAVFAFFLMMGLSIISSLVRILLFGLQGPTEQLTARLGEVFRSDRIGTVAETFKRFPSLNGGYGWPGGQQPAVPEEEDFGSSEIDPDVKWNYIPSTIFESSREDDAVRSTEPSPVAGTSLRSEAGDSGGLERQYSSPGNWSDRSLEYLRKA